MSLDALVQEMVDALEPLTAEIPELQVYGFFNTNPSPPSLDMYPADPFQVGAGFGVGEKKLDWIIRARVSAADPEGASRLLLRLLDVDDPASVERALADADVAVIGNDGGVSGFTRYADDTTADLLGVQWRVETFL